MQAKACSLASDLLLSENMSQQEALTSWSLSLCRQVTAGTCLGSCRTWTSLR